MRNLARANEVRFAQVDVKRKVAAGEMSFEDALDVKCCGSMKVFDLLRAQPRWGRKTGLRLLTALQIGAARKIGELTDRQRRVLLDALARRGR